MTQSDRGSLSGPVIDTPLLATKFFVPRVHVETVRRARLSLQLDKGLHARLMLIAAPAGFGKTTTVVQWLHEKPYPVAWLSLDVRDNEPATFLRYVVVALRTVVPAIGESVLTLLAAPQPPLMETLLTPLLNECAALEHDLVLVLDDYHVLHAPEVQDAVAFLVEHAPSHLHLVITTREEPALPLTRLRARRQLVEIRAADLRFTTDETSTFLHEIMHLPLTTKDVAALEQRTEGWIAGLHLAALAMQARPDVTDFVRAFTGSNRFVVEYLVEEVIERLPAHVRRFVLHTSILDRFCALLCDAVMLGSSADPNTSYCVVLIEQIERMNLFVIPLDNQRYWYRFHHLFADVVRSHLHRTASSETVRSLYMRASEWCERTGLITEAIQYAIRGNVNDRAADLLEQYGETLTAQAGPAELLGWIAQLPRVVLDARPILALTYGMALALTDHFAEATSLLQAVEQIVDAELTDQPSFPAQQAAALRLALAVMQEDQPERIVDVGRRALALIEGRDTPLSGNISLMLGCGYALQGDDQTALALWKTSAAACRLSGDGLMEVNTVAHMGRVLIYRGKLAESERLLRDLVQRADEPYLSGIPTRGYVYAFLSWILYERNALDEAARSALEAIDVCKTWAMPRILLHAYIALALVQQANGDTRGAQNYIEQAEDVIKHDQLKQTFIPVTAYKVRLWLMNGNTESAADWAEQVKPTLLGTFEPAHDVEYLTLARVFFVQGRLAEAEQLLHQLIEHFEALGRERRVIEGYIVFACVVMARGDRGSAASALHRALTLAEPEGYMRMFVDEGAPIAQLLKLLQREPRAVKLQPYIGRLLAAYSSVTPPESAIATPLLPEPLNEREVEILRLFTTGRSNQEIANRLMVARSTVKWHINNLYAKLGVSNRAEALARAQELRLL